MESDADLSSKRQKSKLTYFQKRLKAIKDDEATPIIDKSSSPIKGLPDTSNGGTLTSEVLPIEEYRDDLINAIAEHDVLILIGETGSGKTTRVPQHLMHAGYQRVVCLQPRRVAAISVALRVAAEVGCPIGQTVGYSVRFDDCSSDLTRIRYMTDGMLLRELLVDPLLSNYNVIMVDEAHERTLNTDVLLSLLKGLIVSRPGLKLVISSATMDITKFSDFFNGAPVFSVPGRRHMVDIFYSLKPEVDYISAALKTIIQIHLGHNNNDGDILAFLTGQEEIEFLQDCLERFCQSLPSNRTKMIIVPIFSNLQPEQQALIFRKTPKDARKVVLATNIAETSITIDNIRFVVDCGLQKQKYYNPQSGLEALIIAPTSKASADQRAGRAGRTSSGSCYRLYTLECFSSMRTNTVPEIQRTNLCNVLLLLKALGIVDVLNFRFIDSPDPWLLLKAIEELFSLGSLDIAGNITNIGKIMCDFPLDPRLSKVLISACDNRDNNHCGSQVISIIALLSTQGSLFCPPRTGRQHFEKVRRNFWDPTGDILTLLNVWHAWESANFSRQWCGENFLNFRTLKRARDIREQLISLAKKANIYKPALDDDSEGGGEKSTKGIIKSFLAGYFNQVAWRQKGPSVEYKTSSGMIASIHPLSSLFGTSHESVVFLELLFTSKQYLRVVSVIEDD